MIMTEQQADAQHNLQVTVLVHVYKYIYYRELLYSAQIISTRDHDKNIMSQHKKIRSRMSRSSHIYILGTSLEDDVAFVAFHHC